MRINAADTKRYLDVRKLSAPIVLAVLENGAVAMVSDDGTVRELMFHETAELLRQAVQAARPVVARCDLPRLRSAPARPM